MIKKDFFSIPYLTSDQILEAVAVLASNSVPLSFDSLSFLSSDYDVHSAFCENQIDSEKE